MWTSALFGAKTRIFRNLMRVRTDRGGRGLNQCGDFADKGGRHGRWKRGTGGPWPLWIFIHDTDKVEESLMALFLFFPLPSWKFFCRRPWGRGSIVLRFCADVFYGRLLSTCVLSYVFDKSNGVQKSQNFQQQS